MVLFEMVASRRSLALRADILGRGRVRAHILARPMSVNHGAGGERPARLPGRVRAHRGGGGRRRDRSAGPRVLAPARQGQGRPCPRAPLGGAGEGGSTGRRSRPTALLLVPVWFGNALLLVGTARRLRRGDRAHHRFAGRWPGWHSCSPPWTGRRRSTRRPWLVGRAVGMRFIAYFIRDLIPPFPGVKIDYATYLRGRPGGAAWMHASGRSRARSRPFLALAFWPASDAPGWAAWAIAGYGVLIIGTDVFISTRTSDWKRFRREMRIAPSRQLNRHARGSAILGAKHRGARATGLRGRHTAAATRTDLIRVMRAEGGDGDGRSSFAPRLRADLERLRRRPWTPGDRGGGDRGRRDGRAAASPRSATGRSRARDEIAGRCRPPGCSSS